MAEPTSVAVGAYAANPRLQPRDDGSWTAKGEIQQWRGSLADLAAAASIASEAAAQAATMTTISLTTGEVVHFSALDALAHAATQLDPATIAAVRVEVRDGGALVANVVARERPPAVLVEVTGTDRARVFGSAQLIFSRLMTGYWQPLGPIRGLIILIAAMLPFVGLLVLTNDGTTGWSTLGRLAAGVGTFAAMIGMVMIVGRLLVRRRPPILFVVESSQPGPSMSQRIRAIYEHTWTQRLLYVLTALVIGVIGSEIAEWLP